MWHNNCNFGMHFDLHVGLDETGLGAEITHENLKEMLMIIKPDWIQCDCKGHPGVTGWPTKYGTMSHGVVKDAMRIHSDVCHELGIKLGMHYSGVIDIQACKEHPDWAAVASRGKDGEAQGYSADMTSVCPHSAYYDELMIPQMLELVENYDVDGFWVDGDCWGVRLCYCDKCINEFKEKFGIDAPTENTDPNWKLWLDYHRQLFIDNVNKYTDAVHAKKPECLIISNWMLTFGAPVEDTLRMDYISGDLSNNLGLKSAVLEGHFLPNRKRDWDLMVWAFESPNFGNWTAKSVLHMTQECAYILACGGAAMLYDTPHRNGLFTPWHIRDYGKVSKFIQDRAKYARHSVSVPQIAVIHNPTDYFNATNESAYCINIGHPSMSKYTGVASMLTENHYHFDFLMPSMIKGKFSDYKVIIIPEVYEFDQDFLNELKEYINNGGQVLISGVNATKTFSDILGATGEEICEDQVMVQSHDEVTTFKVNYTKVTPTTSSVFRYIMNQQIVGVDETEYPAVTVNKYGKGCVVGVYFNMFLAQAETHYPRGRRFFAEIMKLFDAEFMVDNIQAPAYVHINVREKNDKYVINLVNTGKVTSAVDLLFVDMVEEIPCVPLIKFRVKLDREPENVMLYPSAVNIASEYKEGYLYVEIKNFDIMESLVIDK